jgi:uncharacterized protein
MRVEYLYRYPVKGLSAEALETAEVEAGGAIPWDRAFALAQGDAGFDPDRPEWLPKQNFMCQMENSRIARLRAFFEPRSGTLTLRAPDGAGLTAMLGDLVGFARGVGLSAGSPGRWANAQREYAESPEDGQERRGAEVCG